MCRDVGEAPPLLRGERGRILAENPKKNPVHPRLRRWTRQLLDEVRRDASVQSQDGRRLLGRRQVKICAATRRWRLDRAGNVAWDPGLVVT